MGLGYLRGRLDQPGGEPDWAATLSSGERQRLALARAMHYRPAFLVLDECTSGLDARSERKVYEQLRKDGVTAITVGHRASVLEYHGRVLALEGGGKWSLKPVPEADSFVTETKPPSSSSDEEDPTVVAAEEHLARLGAQRSAGYAAVSAKPLPRMSRPRRVWMLMKIVVPRISLADESCRRVLQTVALLVISVWMSGEMRESNL